LGVPIFVNVISVYDERFSHHHVPCTHFTGQC